MRRDATDRGQAAFSFWAPLVAIGIMLCVRVAAAAQQGRTWDFEKDRVDEAPEGFSFGRTGAGRMGRWVVRAEKDAPSGTNILAQLDNDATDFRFPLAVANEPKLSDLRLSVRCKPVSGTVDQACGLIARYQDEDNYYVTRANALEQNVRFYKVVNGTRQQLASWGGSVTGGAWHELRMDAQGDHFEVYWDGTKAIDVHDQTFREAGQVGVWTKADSVTAFDDLRVDPLHSQP